MIKTLSTLILATIILFAGQSLFAESKPDDQDALRGVDKGKVVFDINAANGYTLSLYLSVIRETVEDLKRQNVEPDVILAFRGKAVLLISNNRDETERTEFENLDKIAEQVADLQKKGVRMESCSIATRSFGVDNSTLLDGIKPVGNTFVSLTGYQAQGYANIPIY